MSDIIEKTQESILGLRKTIQNTNVSWQSKTQMMIECQAADVCNATLFF